MGDKWTGNFGVNCPFVRRGKCSGKQLWGVYCLRTEDKGVDV